MSDENSFGIKIKRARERMYLTQEQLADKLKVSRVTVTRWENNELLPSAYNLKKLVSILELNEKDADAHDTVAASILATTSQVGELLYGHPLARDQARVYIEETGVSFTEYVKRYQKARRSLFARHRLPVSKDSDYPESVVVTFALCFEKAREQHPLATDILNFCACLIPYAITQVLLYDGEPLYTIPEELFQHDSSFKPNTTEFKDAMAALERYSLIKLRTYPRDISLHHRLVHTVLLYDMPPDLQKRWRDRVVRALHNAFPKDLDFWSWDYRDFRLVAEKCNRLLPCISLCACWSDDELTPTVEAADLFSIAVQYIRMHQDIRCPGTEWYVFYSRAKDLIARSILIYEHLGITPPDIGALKQLYADILKDEPYFFR
jgi:transcriptional regulator with XRE-family HTH domain